MKNVPPSLGIQDNINKTKIIQIQDLYANAVVMSNKSILLPSYHPFARGLLTKQKTKQTKK